MLLKFEVTVSRSTGPLVCQCHQAAAQARPVGPVGAWLAPPTRPKSLSKMLSIVQSERFKFEIDPDNAIHWISDWNPAAEVSTLQRSKLLHL